MLLRWRGRRRRGGGRLIEFNGRLIVVNEPWKCICCCTVLLLLFLVRVFAAALLLCFFPFLCRERTWTLTYYTAACHVISHKKLTNNVPTGWRRWQRRRRRRRSTIRLRTDHWTSNRSFDGWDGCNDRRMDGLHDDDVNNHRQHHHHRQRAVMFAGAVRYSCVVCGYI